MSWSGHVIAAEVADRGVPGLVSLFTVQAGFTVGVPTRPWAAKPPKQAAADVAMLISRLGVVMVAGERS